jgi:hypothetical protein
VALGRARLTIAVLAIMGSTSPSWPRCAPCGCAGVQRPPTGGRDSARRARAERGGGVRCASRTCG